MNRAQRRSAWRARLRSDSRPGGAPLRAGSSGASAPARAAVAGQGAPSAIAVRIAELTLRGFPAGAARQVADGLRARLATLLRDEGTPSAWRGEPFVSRLRGDNVRVATGARPRAIGEDLARAIYAAQPEERP